MEYGLDFFATIGHLMTGFGTIILAMLLYRTLKHLAIATRANEIQTEYKFRPWIGPTGVIREANSDSTKKQFEIMIKNFGDLPATNVLVSSIVKAEKITRDELKLQPNDLSLGPVLPNMEKRFWLDISNEMIEKARQNGGNVFTGVVFQYPLSFGNSEYGLISEVNVSSFTFIHKDMWTSSPSMGSI